MTEQTPGAQRAISPDTQLRSDLRTFLAIMGSVVLVTAAAILWAASLQNKVDNLASLPSKVDTLTDGQRRQGDAIDQIRAALGIRILPTAATPTDRPAAP